MPSQAFIDLSSSISVNLDKRESIDAHFRWDSIKKFIYLACSYSSALINFDIFSKLCFDIRLLEFILTEATFGMAYMFMDFFIKMYSRRVDSPKLLNPLLRGVSFGLLLQTALWTVMHAFYLADSYRFLTACFYKVPPWSQCPSGTLNKTCHSASEIVHQCNDELNVTTLLKFKETSASLHYVKSFYEIDRSVLTTKFFGVAIVWVVNFFLSTVTDDSLIKIFKLSFLCRSFSTIVTLCFVTVSSIDRAGRAFVDIMNVTADHSYMSTIEHVTFIYAIGLLGVQDFGCVSPYTMVDNAVVIYMMTFTIMAFLRSWIVRILYLGLTKCVLIEETIHPHLLFFAVLPLSTEFLPAQKLYVAYIYFNIMVSTTSFLVMVTLTMSRFLHTEFRSIKNIYIVGVLCSAGFGLSVPVTLWLLTTDRILGLLSGLNIAMLYLGAMKMALIMYLYGVRRFATDIQFWLNFKPTRFWTICWTVLPIVYMIPMTVQIMRLSYVKSTYYLIYALIWVIVSVLLTTFFQIKTLARFMMRNNIAGIFSPNLRYGPPDPDDRKRRRNFNETIQLRQCRHNCNPLDEMFDCSHLPLMQRTGSDHSRMSTTSLTNIYESKRDKGRVSTALGLDLHH